MKKLFLELARFNNILFQNSTTNRRKPCDPPSMYPTSRLTDVQRCHDMNLAKADYSISDFPGQSQSTDIQWSRLNI